MTNEDKQNKPIVQQTSNAVADMQEQHKDEIGRQIMLFMSHKYHDCFAFNEMRGVTINWSNNPVLDACKEMIIEPKHFFIATLDTGNIINDALLRAICEKIKGILQ